MVVTRREPCLVAPPEDLLAFTEGAPGCPAEAVCFDAANAARLAGNLAGVISRGEEGWGGWKAGPRCRGTVEFQRVTARLSIGKRHTCGRNWGALK